MNPLYRQLTSILKSEEYSFFRQGKGSHEIWCKSGKDCVTVPANIKSKHTANGILKDVGSSKRIN